MNIFCRLKVKRAFLSSFFCIVLPTLLFGQNGSVKIKVFDQSNGENLPFVNVWIPTISKGTTTDFDGLALLDGLNPGIYKIHISFIGYQTKIVDSVEIIANRVEILEVGLEEGGVTLGEVTVEAKAVRNSENALLTMQKKSTMVMDAVSAEQFKLNGDNNAASAVNRVVGVTVEDGKNVYVRGLGDRYSKVLLNGAEVPSLDPDKNSVQMDMFPSSLIDNIVVYKTFSPELNAEFSGGLVNISTKDFPDQFTFNVSMRSSYNSQTTFNKNTLTHTGSRLDFLAMGAKSRALPTELNGLTQKNFPRAYSDNFGVDKVTKSFNNTEFVPYTYLPPTNNKLNFSIGNSKKILGKQLGFVVGLSYLRNYTYTDTTGRQQRWDGINNQVPTLNSEQKFDYIDRRANDIVTLGGIFNTNLKLNTNNRLGISLMHNRVGNKESRFLQGLNFEDEDPSLITIGESRVLSYQQKAINNVQLKGEHFLPASKVKIDWLSSFSIASMQQPDLKFFFNIVEIDTNSINGIDTTYKLVNSSIRPSRYFRSMNDNILDNRLNLELPFSWHKKLKSTLKFGGAYTSKNRTYRENRYEYFNLSSANSYDGNIPDLFADGNLGVKSDGTLGAYIDDFTEKANNFNASEKIYSAYAMVETPVIKENIKISTGVRFERTNRILNSFNPSASGGFVANDFLPALNFTYQIKEKQNIRLAYGRTLARPTFREFAPLVTFGFGGDNTLVGNPKLTRALIDNFDIRYEIFPKVGEYFGVSLFYKNFTNPIERVTNPVAGGSTIEFTYVNVAQGVLYGTEIEARKKLDFIHQKLKHFKVATNIALIKSAVALGDNEKKVVQTNFNYTKDTRPMFYQSPYVINGSFIYDNKEKGVLANITYSVFGPRLMAFQTKLPPFLMEQPRPELNISFRKSIKKHFSITLRAKNILNPYYQQTMEYNNESYVFSRYKIGRSFSFDITYKI